MAWKTASSGIFWGRAGDEAGGNDIRMTNVPDIRVAYRFETLEHERRYIRKLTAAASLLASPAVGRVRSIAVARPLPREPAAGGEPLSFSERVGPRAQTASSARIRGGAVGAPQLARRPTRRSRSRDGGADAALASW